MFVFLCFQVKNKAEHLAVDLVAALKGPSAPFVTSQVLIFTEVGWSFIISSDFIDRIEQWQANILTF